MLPSPSSPPPMQASPRIGVVINPLSALGKGKRVGQRVIRRLTEMGFSTELIRGTSASASARAIQEALPRIDLLLLVGGDGILSLFLNAGDARTKPFGIIPAGSGNDFARHLGLPLGNPMRALEHALAHLGSPRRVDAGIATGPEGSRVFAGGLSFGFDAAINKRANAIRLPLGPVRYQLALIAEVFTYQPRAFRVRMNGAEYAFDGLLASVMNTRLLGGGIAIAPEASSEDGLFDVVTVDALSRPKILWFLPTLAGGRHIGLRQVHLQRSAEVFVSSDDSVEAFADGERVGRGPFTVRVLPGALSVLG